jgi:DNA-binding CsgD family transcriptional regulator
MQLTRQEEPSHRSQLVPGVRADEPVLVLVAPAERGVAVVPQAIQAVFRLSAAEARLASALVSGRTLAESAREAELSRNTARNQLASVLEKTEVHRQSELVALIVGTLGIVAGCAAR